MAGMIPQLLSLKFPFSVISIPQVPPPLPHYKKASFLSDVTRTPNYPICFHLFVTPFLYREPLILTRHPETLPQEMGVLSSSNVEDAL
jgi:hypothetical protein